MKKWLIALLCAALLAQALCAVLAEDADCSHPAWTLGPVEYQPWYKPLDAGAEGAATNHLVMMEAWQYWICEVCDERGSGHPVPESDYSYVAAHVFEDGVCVNCGYVCAHPNKVYGEPEVDYSSGSYTTVGASNPELYHLATYSAWRNATCATCGLALPSERVAVPEKDETSEGRHTFSNGVCVVCGYVNTCAHENVKSEYEHYKDYQNARFLNERLHTVDVTTTEYVYCDYCWETLKVNDLGVTGTSVEKHNWDEDGVCYDCGYKNACTHPETKLDEHPSWCSNETYEAINNDNLHHYAIYESATFNRRCTVCDMIIGKEEVANYRQLENHHYDGNGVCYECGHVNTCTHEHTTTKRVIDGMSGSRIWDVGSNEYHMLGGDYVDTYTICDDCGVFLEENEVWGDVEEQQPHEYDVSGVCLICGHIKTAETPAPTAEPIAAPIAEPTAAPTAEPTAAPTAEPIAAPTAEPTVAPSAKPAASTGTDASVSQTTELVYEAVSENAVINGVRVSDKPIASDALATIGASLDGEKATVEISGVDKLLTPAEKARFDKLPIKDRLLVTLAALGYGDASDDAMSEEAKALAGDIAARVDGMTQAEKQALLDAIAAEFPVKTVVVDGKNYDGFSIDAVVDRGGDKTYERYTFYNDGSQWILYGIEIGEYKVV